MTGKEFADSLHQIADVVEKMSTVGNYFTIDLWPRGKKQSVEMVKALGSSEKLDYGGSLIFRKEFNHGPEDHVRLDVNVLKADTCTKKVVRIRHIEERYIPGQVEPAHDEETVEWDCESFLAP